MKANNVSCHNKTIDLLQSCMFCHNKTKDYSMYLSAFIMAIYHLWPWLLLLLNVPMHFLCAKYILLSKHTIDPLLKQSYFQIFRIGYIYWIDTQNSYHTIVVSGISICFFIYIRLVEILYDATWTKMQYPIFYDIAGGSHILDIPSVRNKIIVPHNL